MWRLCKKAGACDDANICITVSNSEVVTNITQFMLGIFVTGFITDKMVELNILSFGFFTGVTQVLIKANNWNENWKVWKPAVHVKSCLKLLSNKCRTFRITTA